MNRLKQIENRRTKLIEKNRDLVEKVTAIRENAIANLPDMIGKAKETLEAKLAKVYLANDEAEAAKILGNILKSEKQVARSFSNTLTEIKFDTLMTNLGIKVNLTRIEEIVQSEKDLPSSGHPHLVNIDVTPESIKEALQKFTNKQDALPPAELTNLARQQVKDSILSCEYGVTGANSVVADNGIIVLTEDEGNVRAVSNLPYRHIAIIGIDKVDQSVEDAMLVMKAVSIFGAGQISPTYFSLIAGPSRTADIEFKMAYGMHGPKEVYIILLDNGRSSILKQGASALLKCINCGACYQACAQLAGKQNWQNTVLTPKGFALGIVQGKLAPLKANEEMAEFTCPIGLSPTEVTAKLGMLKS